jgi:murein DD-endopeptidase MepM/ murein hydrolase activator NlpD
MRAAALLALTVALSPVTRDDLDGLRARRLAIPVTGVTCRDVRDTFGDERELRRHEALDLIAAQGTPVTAVERGTIAKLFTSVPGGLTIYHVDPSSTWVYYYAHLDRYADGLREGQAVERGQVIGYVGTSGNAGTTPHLHFAISKLGPEKRWWEGAPANPYPVLCEAE